MPDKAKLSIPRLPHLKYRQKIAFTILVFSLLPLIFFGSSQFVSSWENRLKDILYIYDSQINNSVEKINDTFKSYMDKAIFINSTPKITNFLDKSYSGDLVSYIDEYRALEDIINALIINDKKENFNLYALNDTLFGNGYYVRRVLELSEAQKKKYMNAFAESSDFIWEYVPSNETGPEGCFDIHMYGRIQPAVNLVAISETKFTYSSIAREFEFNIPANSFIAYVSASDKIMLLKNNMQNGNNPVEIVENYLDTPSSGSFYVIEAKIESNSDRVFMFLPKSYVTGQVLSSMSFMILLSLVLIIITFLSVIMTSKLLTRRLTNLVAQVNTDIESLLDKPDLMVFKGHDEFSILNYKFWDLILKIKQYYKNISEYELERKNYELEKKKLELKLLQERINPHFLYNSLSCIKLAFPNKELEDIIDALIRYYRIALNRGNEILSVSEEVDMVEKYIKIQKFAFDSDFNYYISMDESILNCKMLKHILQPIVENAIIHGILGLQSGGFLKITGKNAGDSMIFQITDNGVGMSQDKIDKLLGDNIDIQESFNSSGYGIKNVKNRLDLRFGSNYSLHIDSAIDVGTTVTLKIPKLLSA